MARNKHPEATVRKIVDIAGTLFAQKGYDNTSIQDIIGLLGGLSKGAIYHHFRSKEEILDAVLNQFSAGREEMLRRVVEDTSLNGLQKLQKLVTTSLDESSEQVFSLSVNMMKNPQILALQMRDTVEEIAPNWIYPVIQQGIEDGSLPPMPYPKELAECLLLLTNIWINPMVCRATPDAVEQKCRFLQYFTKCMGIGALLINEEQIQLIKRFTALHLQHTT